MRRSPASGSWGFHRTSVADQAAAALREAIQSGELGDPLPGEHQLSQRLEISRPTVRAALARLASEGLLIIRKGHRSRLAHRLESERTAVRAAVCVVCPVTPEKIFPQEHPLLLEMHAQFASRGVHWEQVFDAKLGMKNPQSRLEQLVAARPQVCWILFATSEPIQRWFATAGVRALVLGSCAPGVNLPSVDLDYGAVGWHAAGAMLRSGHVHVALILPSKLLPGDVASRGAFLRYVEHTGEGVSVTEFSAPDEPAQFRQKVSRLLSGPRRPTALFSMRPTLTLTLIAQVLGMGLRIPRDISIILRDTHPLLESALPELTRYSSPAQKHATRAVRVATTLLAGRRVSLQPSLLTPTYVPGSTLSTQPARVPGST